TCASCWLLAAKYTDRGVYRSHMARRLVNLLLLGLVASLVASGLAGWGFSHADALPLYDLHRALGAGLLVVLLWKAPIAWRSLARRLGRDGSVARGILAAVALVGAVGLGLGWTLGLLGL